MLAFGVGVLLIGIMAWLVGIVGMIITKFNSGDLFVTMLVGCIVANIGNLIIQIAV